MAWSPSRACTGSTCALYTNDASGTFTDASERLPPGTALGSIRTGDVDRDGDLDVMSPGILWLADADGRFVDASDELPHNVPPGDLGLGDVDGDDDLDVAAFTGP